MFQAASSLVQQSDAAYVQLTPEQFNALGGVVMAFADMLAAILVMLLLIWVTLLLGGKK